MAEWKNRRVGNYVLVERLGQGGMGVVYRARDTMLERDVALKMMQPPGEETTRAEVAARFLVEAKAAARIQSRHVAQVLQLGETGDGEVYIAMELLVGEALSSVIQAAGRLDAARAVRIGRQIARGMQAAHALGVVHRDLKPANVMLVTEDGEREVVKILDFGVAKLTRDEDKKNLTQTGMLLGTLPYMAPEQILSRSVDARTDIYTLGIVLFRMLAGAPIFDAENLSDIVRNQVETPAPRFSARVPGLVVPRAIEQVVLRCLEKDPARRFQSMADVDAALGRALENVDEPIQATVVDRSRREETLPTGTRLPPDTASALLSSAEQTKSAMVFAERAPDRAPAPTFDNAPVTEPDAVARPKKLLPIAAAVAVVLALASLAIAVVFVLSLEPAPPTAVAPPAIAPPPPTAPSAPPAPVAPEPPPTAEPPSAPEPPTAPTPAAAPSAAPSLAAPDPPASAAPAAPKPAAVKPAASKPAAAKPSAQKPAAQKPAAQKPAAQKPAAKPTPAPEATPPETPAPEAGFKRVLTKEGE